MGEEVTLSLFSYPELIFSYHDPGIALIVEFRFLSFANPG